MIDPTLEGQIRAAQAYEALFVPALFGQWAAKVADAAHIQSGQRVLDIACGTGVLARGVASGMKSSGSVFGIDPNPGMIAVARQLAPGIEWREGVAESLPYADASFDAVVSQFGLMFFVDRREALREAMRVLVSGGHLVIAVWDSLETMPAYESEVALLENTVGRRAADALRAPFVLGHREGLLALAADAGVPSARVTTHRGTAQFPSIRALVEADLRGWLPLMGISLNEDKIRQVLEAAERSLIAYRSADGRATFDLSVHFLEARKA
ncbi:MAG: methyltransferase domain-containing protein [Steroidobacteraceae bacterium]